MYISLYNYALKTSRYALLSLWILIGCQTLQGCALLGKSGNDRGELISISKTAWVMIPPDNMRIIYGGSYLSGVVDQNMSAHVGSTKQVSVGSFLMDEAPITNGQYRQFIDDLIQEITDAEDKKEALKEESDWINDKDNDSTKPSQDNTPTVISDEPSDKKSPRFTREEIEQKLMPNMNVWVNDFTHHMADHMMENYFEHIAFTNHPVVGITWEAARAFATWRTERLNEYRTNKGMDPLPNFRLPTAAEWEYAAQGGNPLAKYPWGGPYVRNNEGEVMANFKSGRGNFNECHYEYTSPVKSFPANDYGLYDMAGNVAEWTLDAYDPAKSSRVWGLNPLFFSEEQPLKVIKGGSWKDVHYFLQTGVRDYEDKDTPRSYIGFRCIMPYLGR